MNLPSFNLNHSQTSQLMIFIYFSEIFTLSTRASKLEINLSGSKTYLSRMSRRVSRYSLHWPMDSGSSFFLWGKGGPRSLWSQVLSLGGGVSQSGPKTGVLPSPQTGPGHEYPLLSRQDTPHTRNGAGGTPIAVPQEDFLVKI